MKNLSRYYPYLLAGLLVGFTAGAIAGHIIDVKANGSPFIDIASTIPKNGQQNILFVGVDRLDSTSPQLESVWLVLLFPDNPRIVLIPVFPYSGDDSTIQDESLVESFRLTKDRNLTRKFIEKLKTFNIWWTDTIIADRIALAEISNLVQDGNHVGSTKISRSIFKSINKWERNSSTHAQKIVNKILALCQEAHSIKIRNYLPSIFKLFSKHIHSSIKPQEITDELERRISIQGGLICEFPTLHP